MSAVITVRPTWCDQSMSPQGQPMEELVNGLSAGIVPGSPLSIGAISMPPRHAANVHEHRDTWIYVHIVETGSEGVCTLYGPSLEYEMINRAGDILVVSPGVVHGAVNLSSTHPVRAVEVRTSVSVRRDNHVVPHLQHVAEARRPSRQPARRVLERTRRHMRGVARKLVLQAWSEGTVSQIVTLDCGAMLTFCGYCRPSRSPHVDRPPCFATNGGFPHRGLDAVLP